MAISGSTTLSQSGPGSDGNEGALHIPPKLQHSWNQTISVITRSAGYLSVVNSIAQADWAKVKYIYMLSYTLFVVSKLSSLLRIREMLQAGIETC